MMRQMMGGGGMPGMPGMPGMRRASKKAKKAKKKGRAAVPAGRRPALPGSSRQGCRWAPSRGRPGPAAAWAGCPGTCLLASAARAGSGCRGPGPAASRGRSTCRRACAAAARTAAARRAGRNRSQAAGRTPAGRVLTDYGSRAARGRSVAASGSAAVGVARAPGTVTLETFTGVRSARLVITPWPGSSGTMTSAPVGSARPSLTSRPRPIRAVPSGPHSGTVAARTEFAGRRPQPWLSRSS